MRLVINFLLFQFAWFASVLGAANQVPLTGPAAVALVVAVHLYVAKRPYSEFLLVLACGFIGAIFDSVLVTTGWVGYPAGMFAAGIAPYWIIAMWMSFATTLNVSMGWMQGRPWLAAFMGLVAGPLTYLAGAKLGGIQLLNQDAALIAIAFGWAVMMPALMTLSRRLTGMAYMSSAQTRRESGASMSSEKNFFGRSDAVFGEPTIGSVRANGGSEK